MDAVILALRVLLSLAVVLGLLWYMHRRISRSQRRGGKVSPVNVVARHGISPKASVVIVEAEGQRFLLGVTEQSVNVLHTSDAPAALTAVPHAENDDAATAFAKVLTLASRSSAQQTPAECVDDGGIASAKGDYLSTQREGGRSTGQGERGRRAARAARNPQGPSSNSPLAGSILSPETWKQTANAFRQGLG
ncbi:flagellar protein FliO/FliZ [Arthrobacter pigmenti]|uniref:Flagellar protein n=1 Tax=Arthrobacter pigmenti TaxID=271432 RepID=A0A846RSE8_9MICC|nr:flagellar biosynthetic protein FliO [Arthrobacter pigmenti]NJC21241.1 flagellar protein FliO/FliZ [Arthrobacter pigmenti]